MNIEILAPFAHVLIAGHNYKAETDGYWTLWHCGDFSKPCLLSRVGSHMALNEYPTTVAHVHGRTYEVYERMEYVEGYCPLTPDWSEAPNELLRE